LAGVKSAEHFLAERLLGDAGDEVVGDGEVDVGVEKGLTDLAQPLADVGLGEPAAAEQFFQGLTEAALNAFKHTASPLEGRAANLSVEPRPRRDRARESSGAGSDGFPIVEKTGAACNRGRQRVVVPLALRLPKSWRLRESLPPDGTTTRQRRP